jgi:hypothetical protein
MPRSSATKVRSAAKPHNGNTVGFGSHEEESSAQQAATSVHPVEPEDARVTGTTRSLQRRVLGLNVDGGQAQQHPETPAGQHATGSFTGDKGTKSRKKD